MSQRAYACSDIRGAVQTTAATPNAPAPSHRTRGHTTIALRAALLALGICACSGPSKQDSAWPEQTPEQTAAPAEPTARPLDPKTVQLVVKRTTQARGLEQRRPILIRQLSQKDFRARIRKQLERTDSEDSNEIANRPEATPKNDPTEALLLGLNLVPPPDKRGDIAKADAVLQEQIAAYYDRRDDVVVLPIEASANDAEQLQQRAVLAHEIQHALQERHFVLLPMPADATLDERIARLALVEGDAMVTMGAYLGVELDRPVRRTLMDISEMVREVDRRKIHRQRSRQLDSALPIMRASLMFPYREGMLFVTDLYRAGGFDLVNKSYTRPPTSTMQVLHPQKYLDGVKPAQYPAMPALGGLTIKHQLSLGELITRVVIERCNESEVARAVTDGWGGDSMAFGVQPDGSAVTLWLTYWANEQNAQEVVEVLNKPSCWSANASGDTTISDRFLVQRKGNRVVLIRGAERGVTARWMNQLLKLVPREPSPEPLTALRIPKRRRLPQPQPSIIEGDVYLNEWIGVRANIPRGATTKLDDGPIALRLLWPGRRLTGVFGLSERMVSPQANDRAFEDIGRALKESIPQQRVKPIINHTMPSPLGRAEVRVWQLPKMRVRAVLVPICANNGSLIILQAYESPADERLLDDWLQSFEWLGEDRPVCARLDPK